MHWFDPHPTFRNTGLVAIGWYESGLRFLKVGAGGALEEVGYYLPVGARTSATYWRTDRILYTADYGRGVDVLKFTGDIPPGQPEPPAGGGPAPGAAGPPTPAKPVTRGVSFDHLVRMPSTRRCVNRKSLKFKVRKAKDRVTRVEIRINGKPAKRVKGRALKKSIRLRKVPKRKTFSVQVLVRTKSGHKTAGQRTYRGCRR